MSTPTVYIFWTAIVHQHFLYYSIISGRPQCIINSISLISSDVVEYQWGTRFKSPLCNTRARVLSVRGMLFSTLPAPYVHAHYVQGYWACSSRVLVGLSPSVQQYHPCLGGVPTYKSSTRSGGVIQFQQSFPCSQCPSSHLLLLTCIFVVLVQQYGIYSFVLECSLRIVYLCPRMVDLPGGIRTVWVGYGAVQCGTVCVIVPGMLVCYEGTVWWIYYMGITVYDMVCWRYGVFQYIMPVRVKYAIRI